MNWIPSGGVLIIPLDSFHVYAYTRVNVFQEIRMGEHARVNLLVKSNTSKSALKYLNK